VTGYFLAVDGGSQSTKVSVVDASGRVHASSRVLLRPYELGPDGRAVHPDDDLWDSLCVAVRETLASFAGDPDDVVAVGLCGIRSCRALLDAEGRITEPVLSWMDARVGRPLGEVDARVATVTSAGGYLATRLTGERRDSSASYHRTWPIDLTTRDWSTDPAELERTGMPLSLLPSLVDPGGLLGHVTGSAARQTGLPVGLTVHATGNDKAVEALGCGLEPGTVLLSLGTYIAAMTLGELTDATDDRYWVNAAAVPGRVLHESRGIRRGMWTVSWLRDLVGAAAPDLVDTDAVAAWLDAGGRDVPPGCGGLMTIPDWLAPADAPHRRGAILGLDGSHGPHHLHRSILEGIVMTMRGHVEAMEEALRRPAGPLVVSGGGARSDLMMQVVADVFGRAAQRPGSPDAAGLGAAICAAVGNGTYSDFDDAAAAMTQPGDRFEPDAAAHAAYDEVVAVYSQLPRFTDPLWQHMAARGRLTVGPRLTGS
jgi:xylulokinase